MEQDKVKLVKHKNGYRLYINGTEINKVKDFKIDKFGVNSVVTVQLTCVDLEVINENTVEICTKGGEKINLKLDDSVLKEEIVKYKKENMRPKCFGGYNSFLCCLKSNGKCSFTSECEKIKVKGVK